MQQQNNSIPQRQLPDETWEHFEVWKSIRDLIETLPDVVAGTPALLFPYLESARYAAEYRNYYWVNSRETTGQRSTDIIRPPEALRRPYPKSKMESSDKAEGDKGNNFGRIARAGLLDDFLEKTKLLNYLGIRVAHWMRFFKAMSENKTSQDIDRDLDGILLGMVKDMEQQNEIPEYKKVLHQLALTLKELAAKLP
ncbi:MAG: hypothetical protein ACKVUS_14945 [Saprospiraceae bacterium]